MSICLQAWRKNVWEVISDPLLTFLKVKKKKKKTSMIPACLLQMLPDVQPNDGGYDCDNDGFIFFQW